MHGLPGPHRGVYPRKLFQVAGAGKTCEDAFAFSAESRCCALCDGASDSYAGGIWARIVSRGFAREDGLSRELVFRWMREYERRMRSLGRTSLSWYQKAALVRGSFTTLLGVRFLGGGRTAEVVCVGDSLAALVDGRRMVDTFPFMSVEEMHGDPVLVSTDAALNAFLDDDDGAVVRRVWTLKALEHPSVLLMSDVLARWLLSGGEERADLAGELLSIENQEAFADWVAGRRCSGELGKDDCTLVVLR